MAAEPAPSNEGGTASGGLPVRPLLKPGVRRVWRDPATLQLGRDPARAVVVTDVDDPVWQLLSRLDGQSTTEGLLASSSLPSEVGRDLLARLDAAGMLDDAAATSRPLASFTAARRAQLRPEYDALVLGQQRPGQGAASFARRKRAVVAVEGLGRVGSSVALLLEACGVGQVRVHDAALVTTAEVVPGGHRLVDVGRCRQDALRDRLAKPPRRPGRRVDLVVLGDGVDLGTRQRRADELAGADVPHLHVAVTDGCSRVGPLVLPGRSSCYRCLDHHRTDRDPAWPTLLAQLVDAAAETAAASLAALTAALAVAAVTAWLDADPEGSADGGNQALVDAEVVVAPPRLLPRRRSLTPHPACGCTWRGTIAS
jgi:hypothetical protein